MGIPHEYPRNMLAPGIAAQKGYSIFNLCAQKCALGRQGYDGVEMDCGLLQLVDEAINLELNVAKLYLRFKELFPEDSNFWWNLALEETNHAALLRSGRESFMSVGMYPSELAAVTAVTVEALGEENNEILRLLEEFKVNPPSRESAFHLAINQEESAGEIHFQRAMEILPSSEALELFQHLNNDDKDHARRLRTYMNSNGIGQSED